MHHLWWLFFSEDDDYFSSNSAFIVYYLLLLFQFYNLCLVGFSFPICQDYIELFLQMLSVNFKKIFSKEMIVKKYLLKKWYFNIFCPKTVFTWAKVLSEWRNNYDFIKTVICGDYVLTVRTAEEQKVLVHLKTIKNSTKHSDCNWFKFILCHDLQVSDYDLMVRKLWEYKESEMMGSRVSCVQSKLPQCLKLILKTTYTYYPVHCRLY